MIRFGRWVVVQRQLLSTVRLLGRGHGQPAKWALTEIGFLGKAQYLRIEAQGLVLVVHVYAGQFDFHFSFATFAVWAECVYRARSRGPARRRRSLSSRPCARWRRAWPQSRRPAR